MFNFYDEVKKDIENAMKLTLDSYNIVNISGRILYVEGQTGLKTLSKEQIIFKVKKASVIVDGEDMKLYELTENTIKIVGRIFKVEVIWWKTSRLFTLKG